MSNQIRKKPEKSYQLKPASMDSPKGSCLSKRGYYLSLKT